MENENLTQTVVQETENEVKKSKKQLRKEKKLAKKKARAQLRKEIRQRKKDEFRAKGCLGKVFWFFGKLLSLTFAVVLLATVIQVNYAPVAGFFLNLYMVAGNFFWGNSLSLNAGPHPITA